jgi:hypothetical protein
MAGPKGASKIEGTQPGPLSHRKTDRPQEPAPDRNVWAEPPLSEPPTLAREVPERRIPSRLPVKISSFEM